MKTKRTKKYPIFTYLFYLLAVAALVTGVSFARYSVTSTGNAPVQVATFNCHYEIDNFSSFSFDNTDYYSKDDNGNITGVSGSARWVRFTMSNYTRPENDEETPSDITDVDAQGSIRLYLPAMLADNLAIQLQQEAINGAANSVYYPQFVLGEIIYSNYNKYHDGDEASLAYASYTNSSITTETETGRYFTEYGEAGSPQAETWVINGGLTADGGEITVEQSVAEDEGFEMTITAVNDSATTTNYSLGFQRNGVGAPLYLDLSVQEAYYIIDISLPGMLLKGGEASSCQYMAYLTLTHSYANDVEWSDEYERFIITPPSSEGEYKIGDITVTGYHFDQTATTSGNEETTVRVKCEYNNAGGYNFSLFHVAPINEENTAYYVHPITLLNDATLGSSYDSIIQAGVTGTCSNDQTINLGGVTFNPLVDEDGDPSDISGCISRSFNLDMTAVFVQASSVGGQA